MSAAGDAYEEKLAAGTEWIEFGLGPVVQLRVKSKAAVHKDWQKDAAIFTVEEFEAELKKHPRANWGGRCDNVVVLDPDRRGDKRGHVAMRGWQEEHGKLPYPLLATRSGGGGYHLVYPLPEGVEPPKSCALPDVDLKSGSGHQVVLPGSIHPDTRRPYRRVRSKRFGPVDDISQVLALCEPSGNGDIVDLARHRKHKPPIGAPADEGGRNDQIARVAGKNIAAFPNDLEFAHEQTLAWVAQQRPPLDVDEAESAWQSILKIDRAKQAFFEGRRFVPRRVAARIDGQTPIALGHDDRLWRYRDGVWHADGDAYVKRQVRELLGDDHLKRHQSEVLTYLRADLPSIRAEASPRWLNLRNGMLDWRAGELRPHDPADLSVAQQPVEWDPEARCPTVDAFLARILPDAECVEFVYELIGYPLAQSNWLRKAVLLLGPGGNGKSRLLDLMRALYGKPNVSSRALQDLSENRFAVADLFGKLANICGDLDARAVKQSDVFKKWTGLDDLTGERKYGHAFDFTAHAVPIFSANEPPLSSDQSEAWFQRWLVVPLDRDLENAPDKLAPNVLHAKLCAELPGVLVRGVEALRRLERRGRFELPAKVKAAMVDYRQRLDSVIGFIEEKCVIELGEGWTSRSDLYGLYSGWCRGNGRHALNSASFNRRLEKDHGHAVTLATRRGNRGWKGIRLRKTGAERDQLRLEEER